MIEIPHVEDSSSANEMIHYCTIIAKAFADALDQNECNLKVVVSLAEDLKDTIRDSEDMYEIIYKDPTVPPTQVNRDNSVVIESISPTPVDRVENQAAISSFLKQSCFKCEFGLPEIDILGKLEWSWNKLKVFLDVYAELFDQLLDPNFCHAAYAFQYTCVPDILKLIAMLLSVYAAVLALRRLGGISLNAFVKGVISGLLGQIINTFKIQVDFSKTGIGCVINLLEELASLVPDGENLATQLSKEDLELLNIDDTYSFAGKSYIEQLQKQSDAFAKDTSNVFKSISETVNRATEDFNENLESIFNIIDYLQCEIGRSGAGFLELAEYLQKLINIINLLSSIATMVAKRQIQKKLCTTKQSETSLNLTPTADDIYTPITELEINEVISEYLGKVVEETKDANDNVIPLIYEKDKQPILPKLNLLTCNLKDFINAHSIEEITKKVVEDIQREELEKKRSETAYNKQQGRGLTELDSDLYSVKIDDFTKRNRTWEEYPLTYSRPTFLTQTSTTDIVGDSSSNINTNKDNALQSILDFVYNNPLTRTSNTSSNSNKEEDKGVNVESSKTKEKVKFADLGSSITNQTSFDSKCREIEDILNKIKKV